MVKDLTRGKVTASMLLFAGPMIAGNLLQQFYNIADTLVVGRVLGPDALAATGAAYAFMIFLTSILLGLSMGSGTLFSMLHGAQKQGELSRAVTLSFLLIGAVTVLLEGISLVYVEPLLILMQIPKEIQSMTGEYLRVIFVGIFFTFLYNYFASLLRSLGNSLVPLVFLGISAVMNIALDLLFVMVIPMGVAGAALATVIAQAFSGIGIAVYAWKRLPHLRPTQGMRIWDKGMAMLIGRYSILTCIQQSVMNFGILLVQGLVNSFGVSVMAAFSAAVKIDSFAYMPVQDFGNAFSTFIAQNFGAGKKERINRGIRCAFMTSLIFSALVSIVVCLLAPQLMQLFVSGEETEVIRIGAEYLRIEGACYCGIGCLFLLYGLYRALGRPGISVILTVLSLGSRVVLAYTFAAIPSIGLVGVWWSVPIGWALADAVGLVYYFCFYRKKTFAVPIVQQKAIP